MQFFPPILITGSRVTKWPPTLCNFLFTYLYSIQFIYYFISFSFIYRVRFHISIQSYGNSNLHMSVLNTCTLIIRDKLRKKRWNNKEIFIQNKYVNSKLKKGVVIPCQERLVFFYGLRLVERNHWSEKPNRRHAAYPHAESIECYCGV